MESTLPEHLESERLIIRAARPGDGAMFHEASDTRVYSKIGCRSTNQ